MSQSATTEDEFRAKASIPEGAVPLESILCTEELDLRPSRPPDYEKENCALVKLMSALADSPNTVFQTLTETILDITRSHSAGVSLLTRDGKALDVCGNRFFWPAVAGMWKAYIGGGTPRDFGPCGDVLDRNCSLPFRHLERRYTYFPPPINECLLVPFYVAGKAVGTIWALAHDDQRKFDAEDNRVMVSLGKFASSAYQALTHIEDLKFEVAEREKAEAEVRELARGLEARVAERTSELQHSAQELQRNEFYLAEGQRLGHTGSWAFNSSGFFEYWSPELFQIYGLDPQKGAPTLEQYLATIHPQDREFMAEAVKRMCEQSSGCDVKKRIIRADGEIRYVRCVGVPVLDSQVLKGFLGTAMDVTEHELLTQELRRRAAYLAEAQKLSHTGSFGWSPDSGEIVWSDETYRIFERDRAVQPTIGSVAQRVHPEDRADFQRVIDAASAEATHFEHTYRLLLPDGRVKHVHALANALEDASGNREFVGAVTDITERNRAEEALRVAMSERTRLSAVRAEVATALASKDDLPRILNKCADAVVQHLDAAFTRIWTLKHGGGRARVASELGDIHAAQWPLQPDSDRPDEDRTDCQRKASASDQ
jgi:PAS domain S-box-containing protein